MAAEHKWKANAEKVAFMKSFPGLTAAWEEIQGKTVATVIPLKSKAGSAVLIFTDGTFLVAPPHGAEPYQIGESLAAARAHLEPVHRAAYAEYDRLVQRDKEALRAARLEKILGAIQNNLDLVPELKHRLKELVKEWK